MPAVLVFLSLLVAGFGPARLHVWLSRRAKDRHPAERFTSGSSLDRELERRLSGVTVPDQAATISDLAAAWQHEPVTGVQWDGGRGSLVLEAAGRTVALAVPDSSLGRGVAAMYAQDRPWIECWVVAGVPSFRLTTGRGHYWITPHAVARLDHPRPG